MKSKKEKRYTLIIPTQVRADASGLTLDEVRVQIERVYRDVKTRGEQLSPAEVRVFEGAAVPVSFGEKLEIEFGAPANPTITESVDILDLSVRACNVLENAGIRQISQLVNFTKYELRRLNRSTDRVVTDIAAALAKHGLKLAEKMYAPQVYR